MRSIARTLFLAIAVLLGGHDVSAQASDFYNGLLRRGTTAVDAGRFEESITPLRLAAFGLLESVDQYQTAQVYLAIALSTLNRDDEARAAAHRVVAAERIEPKFGTLHLPSEVRTKFEGVARELLPAAEVTLLTKPAPSRNGPAAPAPAQAVSDPPRKEPAAVLAAAAAKPAKNEPAGAPGNGPQKTAPMKSTAPSSAPAATSTTAAAAVKPDPRPTQTGQVATTTAPAKPAAPRPAGVQNQAAPANAKASTDLAAMLAAGERALAAANLTEARRIYRELLQIPSRDHATWIRVAEGLYRSREFAGAVTAFERVGALRPGEEAYRYYMAVSLYETGDYARAKRELAAAMPYIELTPDVQRYRTRIEGAGKP